MIARILAGLTLLQPTPALDFAPDTGWQDNEWGRTFYEDWFGNQLRAMGEPPLTGDSDLAGYQERFRLLVLPTFWPGYAYRIDVRPDGSGVLTWSRLNGRGGYEPGRLARQGTRRLRPNELRDWRHALTALATATREMQDETDGTINADGTQNVSICVDGTMLVFEHLTLGSRNYVIRDCGMEDSLRELANVILRMKPRNRMN